MTTPWPERLLEHACAVRDACRRQRRIERLGAKVDAGHAHLAEFLERERGGVRQPAPSLATDAAQRRALLDEYAATLPSSDEEAA